jgi:hypothetical protein
MTRHDAEEEERLWKADGDEPRRSAFVGTDGGGAS